MESNTRRSAHEDLIEVDSNLPEVRAWRKRDAAIERKVFPKRGVTICWPHCGDFYPKRPPEAESNDKEFDAIRDRKAAELDRKVLAAAVLKVGKPLPELVFPSSTWTPMDASHIRRDLNAVLKKADAPDPVPRHAAHLRLPPPPEG